MTNGKTGVFASTERPRDGWVIGIALGEHSKAFYYPAITREGVVNDFVGPYPVALYANPDTRNVQVYLRQVGDEVVTLALDETGQNLIDVESGHAWTVARGLDKADPSGAQPLLSVPYISSFDWAWLDSHPNSEFFQ